MPLDNTSEIGMAASADLNTLASGNNTGRRRARRTTGQLSDRSGGVLNNVNESLPQLQLNQQQQQFQAPIVNAPLPPVRSPIMESLENLTEDIADVPAGGNLPPIRLPPKPMRVVAPIPVVATVGSAGPQMPSAGSAAEPPFFYVQKAHGFRKTKGWPAMLYPRHRVAGVGQTADGLNKEQLAAEEQRQAENELLEVGLVVQRVQQTTGLFICGFLAGLTSWYIIGSQLLFMNLVPKADSLRSDGFSTFILFYQQMAMPIGCVFYALLAFCLLTIIDRYDVSFVTRKDLLQALRLQNGAVPLILLYTAALVITLVCTQHDASIYNVTAEKLNSVDLSTTTPTSVAMLQNALFTQSPQSITPPAVFQRLTASPTAPQSPTPMLTANQLQSTQATEAPFSNRNRMMKDMSERFEIEELEKSVSLWLRLGFARAACCTLAWLILVITNDQDRLAGYLRSMMEQSPAAKVAKSLTAAQPSLQQQLQSALPIAGPSNAAPSNEQLLVTPNAP